MSPETVLRIETQHYQEEEALDGGQVRVYPSVQKGQAGQKPAAYYMVVTLMGVVRHICQSYVIHMMCLDLSRACSYVCCNSNWGKP